jgi:DNA-binding CsgD family transcriptional regulator
MRAAAASLRALPGDVARAGALEDVAEVLAASSVPDAVARLDDALALYDGAGCVRDAARVRRRLRDAGVRRRRVAVPRAGGWAGLTAAELAVVEVVAGGATNRDAAEQLFLSPHTVSSHLRHAFEKLGISSRVELAKLFAERAGATDG